MAKPSVLSRIKVTSPLIESLRSEFKSERKSFVESLNAEQLGNLFPPSANLGNTSDGQPITRDQIATQSSVTPIAQTQDGAKVMTDPVTGKLIVVSSNPDDVTVQKPEDAEKLQQLALLAQQTQTQAATAPSDQTKTHDQNVAQQKAVQQQSVKRVNESGDTLKDFISNLQDLFSDGPKYKSTGEYVDDSKPKETEECDAPKLNEEDETTETSTAGGGEINEEEDSSSSDSGQNVGFDTGISKGALTEEPKEEPTHPDGLVEVGPASDTLMDPTDAIKAMDTSFWTPPKTDLQKTVSDAQNNLGINGGTVSELPEEEKPKVSPPNMAQYVKTGLNSMPGMPGDVVGNDFDDILGLESPFAIKLALSIGKN